MSTCCKRECTLGAIGLNHDDVSDFTRSCWQKGDSPLPLLVIRTVCGVLFVCIGIATIVTFRDGQKEKWLIYMTHWGVLMIVAETSLGVFISAKAYFKGFPDYKARLPWYVKLYWVMFNTSTVTAFLVTVFYWAILHKPNMVYANSVVTNVSVHAINSAVMGLQLLLVAHPSRLLHFYQPLLFAGVYMVFGLVYYHAGGTDPRGNGFVYPPLDWSKPKETLIVLIWIGVLILILHLLACGVASVRDALAARVRGRRRHVLKISPSSSGVDNEAFSGPKV